MRLVEALGGFRDTEVVWGETDCVSLCIRGLRAMYPPDDVPLPSDRPTWTTEAGALKVLHREPPFHEVLAERGCTEVGANYTQNGDIACGLPQTGPLEGYGICVAGGLLHVSGDERVVWDRLRYVRIETGSDVLFLRPPHG